MEIDVVQFPNDTGLLKFNIIACLPNDIITVKTKTILLSYTRNICTNMISLISGISQND